LAKPSPNPDPQPRLLVLELWGLGDLALALPFLRAAASHAQVTLVAKPHAAPLLTRFAPDVEHLPLTAPWTAFYGKYRLHRWPWRKLVRIVRELRSRGFDAGVTARPDPREHLLLALGGVSKRVGFARAGSQCLLNEAVQRPTSLHRAGYWGALAATFGWNVESPPRTTRAGRHVVIHPGAGHPVRIWPRERYEQIAMRLRAANWNVEWVEQETDLDALMDTLAGADRFIGNDSGPGHLAAVLGVPTFTIFGPQLPESFAPQHPDAGWIEGAPCPYKPCFDSCRFSEPHCVLELGVETVWTRLAAWLPR
jgi:heptosyltransferase-2